MTVERHELRLFLNQPVVIVGRLSKQNSINGNRHNACLRAIEMRPLVGDTAIQTLDAVRVHHGWLQLTGMEYSMPGLVPMLCTAAMVSRYTRSNGSTDLGFSPFASVCLDFVVRRAAMKKTDVLAKQFIGDQLNDIEQGRSFYCLQADPATVLMQLKLWLIRDSQPPPHGARLTDILSMIGIQNCKSTGFVEIPRKNPSEVSGFG